MRLLLLVILVWLSACAQQPPADKPGSTTPTSAPSPAPAPTPLPPLDLSGRPGERALLAGIKAYEDADYKLAEAQFLLSLKTGMASRIDTAAAHKYLAFIYCSSNRFAQCEAAFRSAFDADPSFSLSKSEAGHPLWGSVYQRAARP